MGSCFIPLPMGVQVSPHICWGKQNKKTTLLSPVNHHGAVSEILCPRVSGSLPGSLQISPHANSTLPFCVLLAPPCASSWARDGTQAAAAATPDLSPRRQAGVEPAPPQPLELLQLDSEPTLLQWELHMPPLNAPFPESNQGLRKSPLAVQSVDGRSPAGIAKCANICRSDRREVSLYRHLFKHDLPREKGPSGTCHPAQGTPKSLSAEIHIGDRPRSRHGHCLSPARLGGSSVAY